tara:strand:+ start:57 stop:359 length:303 start_codon:yes stop_codon:yes gene_type:complete
LELSQIVLDFLFVMIRFERSGGGQRSFVHKVFVTEQVIPQHGVVKGGDTWMGAVGLEQIFGLDELPSHTIKSPRREVLASFAEQAIHLDHEGAVNGSFGL